MVSSDTNLVNFGKYNKKYQEKTNSSIQFLILLIAGSEKREQLSKSIN